MPCPLPTTPQKTKQMFKQMFNISPQFSAKLSECAGVGGSPLSPSVSLFLCPSVLNFFPLWCLLRFSASFVLRGIFPVSAAARVFIPISRGKYAQYPRYHPLFLRYFSCSIRHKDGVISRQILPVSAAAEGVKAQFRRKVSVNSAVESRTLARGNHPSPIPPPFPPNRVGTFPCDSHTLKASDETAARRRDRK
jgi:hypothetical protein